MSELLKEAKLHYEQLAPHAKDRQTSQLFKQLIDVLENQWQPIETIPLDTEVLLTGTMDNYNDWRIKVGGKLSATGEFKIFGASWSPRYWQPLPQPPKEKS